MGKVAFCILAATIVLALVYFSYDKRPNRRSKYALSKIRFRPNKKSPPTTNTTTFSIPSISLPSGTTHKCLGPFRLPPGEKAITSFFPSVTEHVHHVVLMRGKKRYPRCDWSPGSILFAWARNRNRNRDQESAQRFTLPEGYAFYASDDDYFWIDAHFETDSHVETDVKAPPTLTLTLTYAAPRGQSPLTVNLAQRSNFLIPPQIPEYDVCLTCRALQETKIIAYRNHAHEISRRIYASVYRGNTFVTTFGDRSTLDAQKFYLQTPPVTLLEGDTIDVHCMYDASSRLFATPPGVPPDSTEMCNQYWMHDGRIECDAVNECRRRKKKTLTLIPPPTPMGQVSGVAALNATDFLLLTRQGNGFFSTQPILANPILRFRIFPDGSAHEICSFGADAKLIVPHGLSVSSSSNQELWVTDTFKNAAIRFSPSDRHPCGYRVVDDEPPLATFDKPTDVAADDRYVYVADGYGNRRVAVFHSANLTFAGQFSADFDVVHSVVVASGRVFAADRDHARVLSFDVESGLEVGSFPAVDGAPRSRSKPYLGHFSSIEVVGGDAAPDLAVTAERGGVYLRRLPRGELVAEIADGLDWPHDADGWVDGDGRGYVVVGDLLGGGGGGGAWLFEVSV